MYELIVNSLLMRWPIHGYLIVKIMNDQIGPWAKISSGTLYTILNRLEEAGLITVKPQEQVGGRSQEERRSRTFMIMDEGRKRFRQLMMGTSSNLGDYQKFFYHKRLMKHIEQNWQAEHKWVRGIREEELAKLKT